MTRGQLLSAIAAKLVLIVAVASSIGILAVDQRPRAPGAYSPGQRDQMNQLVRLVDKPRRKCKSQWGCTH